MKLLYGVQGTGNGHITRAIALTQALSQFPEVEVDVLVSGRQPEHLPLAARNVDWRRGLTFYTHAGSVQVRQTLTGNNLVRLLMDVNALQLDHYDVIISDFEPVVAWSTRRRGRPCIGFGHQYAFYFDIPMRGNNPLNLGLLKSMAPADRRIGLHWHHFDYPILPPVIDVSVPEKRQIEHNKIVVYLPFEDAQQITELLRRCGDYNFYIYHPQLTDSDDANIHCRKTSRQTFQQDLNDCNGVICNTGFELISECLALGVKVLTKPLGGQFEQLSNGAALQHLDYATVTDNLFLPSIEKWLKSSKSIQINYPSVQQCLARWLHSGAIESTEELAHKMWRDVEVIRRV